MRAKLWPEMSWTVKKVARSLSVFALIVSACWACRSKPELPSYGQIQAFKLEDQEGHRVSQATFRGKTWVAAFMFTRCPTVCPRITRTMRELQSQANERDLPLHWVSFSVDPEHDTPAVLKQYAKEFHADLSHWSFLTGDYEVVKRTAVEGFKVALEGSVDENADHLGIIHGSHLMLVDSELKLRGYYRTSDTEAMQQLLNDAERLTQEQ